MTAAQVASASALVSRAGSTPSRAGRRHMEHVDFTSEFDDMPYAAFSAEMRAAYARMLAGLAEDRARAAAATNSDQKK